MTMMKNINMSMINRKKTKQQPRKKAKEKKNRWFSTFSKAILTIHFIYFRYWATPGRTAIPGRPVARAEQAPGISPVSKNQFNIVVSRKPRIRY